MKLSGESQAVLIKYALIAGGAYLAYKLARDGISSVLGGSTIDLTEQANTLGQGLQHPIDALSALFKTDAQLQADIQAANPNGVYLTQNYANYIAINGGQDAYIKAHKNGTFTGAPYNAAITYQKPFLSTIGSSINPLFFSPITAPYALIKNLW